MTFPHHSSSFFLSLKDPQHRHATGSENNWRYRGNEVPIPVICLAYFSGPNFREYPHNSYGLKKMVLSTRSSINWSWNSHCDSVGKPWVFHGFASPEARNLGVLLRLGGVHPHWALENRKWSVGTMVRGRPSDVCWFINMYKLYNNSRYKHS